MLNVIWVILLFAAIVTGLLTGRMKEISEALLSSSTNAVELSITMLGAMCLWSGLMKVAERSGLVNRLAVLLRGVFKLLFPGIPKDHPANGAIAMSLTADFLGLGNASTPLGILAMKELSKINGERETASNAMVMFAVINAACIQLIPATVLILRQQQGSLDPASVMLPVWLASAVSMASGLVSAKILEKFYLGKGRSLR